MKNFAWPFLMVTLMLASVTYLYLQSAVIDLQVHEKTLMAIHAVETLDVQINQNVLGVRAGLQRSYQPLNQAFQNLYAALDALHSYEQEYTTNKADTAHLVQHLSALRQTVQFKEDALESFKSSSATLRNSLMYFISLHYRLMDLVNTNSDILNANALPKLLGQIGNRALQLLQNPLSNADTALFGLLQSLDTFKWTDSEISRGLETDLKSLVTHGRLIVQHLQEADALLRQAMTLPSGEQILALKAAYLAYHTRAEQRAYGFRQMLYGTALLLVAYLTYLFIRLRNNTRQLIIANTQLQQAKQEVQEYASTLEHKVTERTDELAQANHAISHLNACLKQENLRMGGELEITRRLQQMILPRETELAKIGELEIAGFMEASSEVGGDYYDVLQHGEHVKFGIGDVTGHGLESGVLMLMAQTAVRVLLLSEINEPKRFLTILNQVLYANIKRMGVDKNMTLVLLDYHAGGLRICGQHEEVLVVRQGGRVERLDTIDMGFMLGMVTDISEHVNPLQMSLEPGDGVVLYTDGITEAFNAEQQMYGVERLCEVVSRVWEQPAAHIRDAVIADLRRHIGEKVVLDDISMLIVKRRVASA
jgi:serine phosphatase RsbU (regulator of sigma subunit)